MRDRAYRLRVVRVHDGDTVIGNVHHWPPIIGREMEFRLLGWDAPELHDLRPDIRAKAEKARDRLKELLAGEEFAVIDRLRKDKFFRIDVRLRVLTASAKGMEWLDVAEPLAAEGLLLPYTGEGPKPWGEGAIPGQCPRCGVPLVHNRLHGYVCPSGCPQCDDFCRL